MKTNIYIKLLIFTTLIVTVFHLFIIAKIIPYDVVWGGRLKADNEMYSFEVISIFINLFLISILLMKGSYLKFQINKKIINIVLWIFFFIFILNTIGNVLANTTFEKLFSILTLISSLLIWNILMKKEQQKIKSKN